MPDDPSFQHESEPGPADFLRALLEGIGQDDFRVNGCICTPTSKCYLHAFTIPRALVALGVLQSLAARAELPDYHDGFVDGLAAYAYSSSEPWAENGVQYVGTSATRLRDATENARSTWNYRGER